jgi:nucleoside-diphosphate-sugar epimerase
MNVFVTGASGHIGSALVRELLSTGHQVTGLARSESSGRAIASLGATPLRADLDDLDSLRAAAAASDGVAHLAFKHDLNDIALAAKTEWLVVQAIGGALEGSNKPFVLTSGTLQLAFGQMNLPGFDSHARLAGKAPGRVGSEQDVVAAGPRVDAENYVVGLAEQGVRSSAVRLSPIVHSSLDHHGFAHLLINTARERGVSAYVDDGSNRWPSVHTLDAAHLFRLALEKGPAGSRFHGVADEGVPFSEIAEVIGRHLDLPVVSIAQEKAGEHFGFLGALVGLDNPCSSKLTQEALGWRPAHAGLLEDLEAGHYFAAPSAIA